MRPTLSPRHELFVRHYRKTHVASRAYLLAGYKPTTRNALDASASALLRQRKIQLRIRELDRQMADRTRITVETLLRDLAEDRALARETKQVSAAIQATQLSAKLVGLLIERKESGAPGDFANAGSAEDVLAIVRKELGAEFADAIAAVVAKTEASEADPPADVVEPEVTRGAEDTLN